jgi:hypothetical protein
MPNFKIYERILANKMTLEIEGKLAEELYAFRKGRATTDLFFGVTQLIEKKWEYDKELVMIFTDYMKASDSIRGENICKSLEKLEFQQIFREK